MAATKYGAGNYGISSELDKGLYIQGLSLSVSEDVTEMPDHLGEKWQNSNFKTLKTNKNENYQALGAWKNDFWSSKAPSSIYHNLLSFRSDFKGNSNVFFQR